MRAATTLMLKLLALSCLQAARALERARHSHYSTTV